MTVLIACLYETPCRGEINYLNGVLAIILGNNHSINVGGIVECYDLLSKCYFIVVWMETTMSSSHR